MICLDYIAHFVFSENKGCVLWHSDKVSCDHEVGCVADNIHKENTEGKSLRGRDWGRADGY